MLNIVSATKFEKSVSAIVEVKDASIRSCSLVRTNEGEIKVFAPTVPYTKKDGTKGYDRIIVFKDLDAANKQAAELLENQDTAVKLFDTPTKTNIGDRIGYVTIKADCNLHVTVMLPTEDKEAALILPSRIAKNGDDDKGKKIYYVWPFATTGDELKAEIKELTDKILEVAKDYVPKAADESAD